MKVGLYGVIDYRMQYLFLLYIYILVIQVSYSGFSQRRNHCYAFLLHEPGGKSFPEGGDSWCAEKIGNVPDQPPEDGGWACFWSGLGSMKRACLCKECSADSATSWIVGVHDLFS